MSKPYLNVTVSNVDRPIFDGEVLSVRVPGVNGEMEILANHEPLISPLSSGKVILKKVDGSSETHSITAGTLEVSHNHATILI